jgi:predicted ester cyclase
MSLRLGVNADHREEATMERTAVDVVRLFYEEVINANRLDLLDEVVDATYVNHGPFPWAVRTLEDLRKFFLVRELGFPDVSITIDEIVANGDLVSVRTTVRGTDTGEFLGIVATGKPVEVSAMGFARVRNQRIVEAWGLIDDLGILEQIGVDLQALGRHAERRSGALGGSS